MAVILYVREFSWDVGMALVIKTPFNEPIRRVYKIFYSSELLIVYLYMNTRIYIFIYDTCNLQLTAHCKSVGLLFNKH